MYFIKKNDKPSYLQRKFNIIKVTQNTLQVPINQEADVNNVEKLALKTKKILNKISNSKKIIISKDMQKYRQYINYLNSFGFEVSDGKWLFQILATDTIEYIIRKKKLNVSDVIISVLINDLTDIELENIKILARTYKCLNIVTNHIEKFQRLEQLFEEEGILLTITNNKKKSLMKSNIILNVDFPKELFNKYMIRDDAIVVNLQGNMKINKKRFNGLNINNYEIKLREDLKTEMYVENIEDDFYLRDLYESEIYKKQRFDDIRNKIKLDKVEIKKLVLNNSEF